VIVAPVVVIDDAAIAVNTGGVVSFDTVTATPARSRRFPRRRARPP